MQYLGKKEIEDISTGASLLGTGGGGDPYVGKLMVLNSVEKYGPIKFVSINELDEEDVIATFAMVGAPTVLVEKIPNSESVGLIYEEFTKYHGKSINAVLPSEVGGVNSMIPLIFAAVNDIPVIDADGMGRAFPEMQMDTFSINGIHNTPSVLADEKGNTAIVNTEDSIWTEKITRSMTNAMGGSILNGVYILSKSDLMNYAIKDTLTLAMDIGETLRTKKQPVAQLLKRLNGKILFKGKIIDVERKTDGGFVKGKAILEGLIDDAGKECVVEFQNENLVCLVDGVPKCMTPDLITILDAETAVPITTEQLSFGKRCLVLGQPCDRKWRSEKGVETVGPQYFGYNYEYAPIEIINGEMGL